MTKPAVQVAQYHPSVLIVARSDIAKLAVAAAIATVVEEVKFTATAARITG